MMAEQVFGITLTNSAGRVVPVRFVAEQHITEDLGRISSFADWARCIRPEPWMGRSGPIPSDIVADAGPVASAIGGEGGHHGR